MPGVPGGAAFGWLMLAVALWSLTSAMHTLVGDRDVRITIAKVQYLGIAPIGVLWLLFTTGYSRVSWPGERLVRVLVWAVPVGLAGLARVTSLFQRVTEDSTSIGSSERKGPSSHAPCMVYTCPTTPHTHLSDHDVIALTSY